MFSARLLSVQALYETMHNQKSVQKLVDEYLDNWANREIGKEKLAEPNGALLKTILHGVDERLKELEELVQANFQGSDNKNIEPLLKAILFCGAYELLSHQDIDFPIIINDYLNITHGFYGQGEVSLVNGVLDAIAKVLRS